jgi:putative flippase GtrA
MSTDIASPALQRPNRTRRQTIRRLVRFAGVGIVSTIAYALLYLAFRQVIGPFVANALALLLTAVVNTAANRRLTFEVRGSSGLVGDHVVGLLAFGVGLLITSGALALLHAVSRPSRILEVVVLTLANAVATILRFIALQLRIHSARRHGEPAPAVPSVPEPPVG